MFYSEPILAVGLSLWHIYGHSSFRPDQSQWDCSQSGQVWTTCISLCRKEQPALVCITWPGCALAIPCFDMRPWIHVALCIVIPPAPVSAALIRTKTIMGLCHLWLLVSNEWRHAASSRKITIAWSNPIGSARAYASIPKYTTCMILTFWFLMYFPLRSDIITIAEWFYACYVRLIQRITAFRVDFTGFLLLLVILKK